MRKFWKNKQKDPGMLGYGDIFESYQRFNRIRKEFKGFCEQEQYNSKVMDSGK